MGAGLKYVHEDLGSDVGGPTTHAVLVDLGSIYYLGYGSVRIATSLANFGPEMTPSGQYVSPYTGETRSYDGFDPPLMFRYGIAFEPIENERQRMTASFEVNQPADNALVFKGGGEWVWQRMLALRSGYNFNADEMNFSAGAGVRAGVGTLDGQFDYAYTDGGLLGSIHRFTLGVRF